MGIIVTGPIKKPTPPEYKVLGCCSIFLLLGGGLLGLYLSYRAADKPDMAELVAQVRFGSYTAFVIAAVIALSWYLVVKFLR